MLPAVIRTSFPGSCVIFRLWKCSCSTRINKSPPLTPIIAVLYCYHKPLHVLECRRDSRTASLSLLVYDINEAEREKQRCAVFTPWDSEIPMGRGPLLLPCSPHPPVLIAELSSQNTTVPPKAHTLLGLCLPGARTMLGEISLISPRTAFVFKTAKCQLRHKNAERSRLLLCWRGESCSPGHSRHWGVSWMAGAQHGSVTP